jgi:hypothetical protein
VGGACTYTCRNKPTLIGGTRCNPTGEHNRPNARLKSASNFLIVISFFVSKVCVTLIEAVEILKKLWNNCHMAFCV